MLFNSLEFLLFFPIVCIIYFGIRSDRWRNIFLLAASYYFYMCWEPVYALLLLASTVITYTAAIGIDRWRKYARTFLIISAVANLSILFFFKYFNWAAENLSELMALFGVVMNVPEFNVLLPVGISFYTFQALGYSIDVYRGTTAVEKDFPTYALFVSFFPQLVAGPIERSTSLLPQFREHHRFDGDRAITGIHLMLWGFFLKLVVADNCALVINRIHDGLESATPADMFLAAFLFCFQLYGDFAGYSYIAIGASRVMGFHLMDNFLRPYFFSTSVQEFWKRNHISLTTWFMDYIYYPLVGSSTSLARWCFCIFFTFFLSGFWHGANWTYVFCFSIFGIYLVICTLKARAQKRFEKRYGLRNKAWWIWTNRVITFLLVMLALVFFRADNINDGWHIIKGIFTYFSDITLPSILPKRVIASVGLLFCIEYLVEYGKAQSFAARHFLPAYICSSLLLLLLIAFIGNFSGGQFIYFQF